MKQYQITEIHRASSDSNLYPYNYEYANNDNIEVFLNNNPVSNTVIYDEDEDNYSIEIDPETEISEGDSINILITKESDNLNILTNANIDVPNTLFNKYLPKESNGKLKANNLYVMHVNIDGEEIETTFTSRLTPMFTTAKAIKQDIGEFIPDYTDELINSVIRQKSQAVIELIDELANQDNPVTNVTYEQDKDGFYTTEYSAVKNWVRYATDIQLIYSKYFGISYNYGTIKKEIGDIKIERNVKLPYIDNMLDWLKKALETEEFKIRGINSVAVATRGKDTHSYEDWERTTNF